MSAANYEELRRHIGHNIVCVGYAWQDGKPGNVAVECEDCYEVLLDFDQDEEDEESE